MPKLWEQHPELVLDIVGANPTPRVRELQAPRVEVVGFVPDPFERLTRARVHVHPLRFGAGIKLKLIDTMAAGLPFVTTPIGAEGLGLGELEDALVAEDVEGLARLALQLYGNATSGSGSRPSSSGRRGAVRSKTVAPHARRGVRHSASRRRVGLRRPAR